MATVSHSVTRLAPVRGREPPVAVAITGGVLVALLVVLYAVAINNTLPPEIAEPMDALGAQAE